MIVIDGVRYILRTPSNEDDLEQMVKEHSRDIWGENSVYFERKKLQTQAGIGSIPDGYVVVFGRSPQWHVVEVELSSHPLYEHIVAQISKFATGVSNTASQHQIAGTMYGTIEADEILKAWVKNNIGSAEVYKFLIEMLTKPPVLTIVIDERTRQLDEACEQLPTKFQAVKVVEFKTFHREGCESIVHAHLFEPLYKLAIGIKPADQPEPSIKEEETGAVPHTEEFHLDGTDPKVKETYSAIKSRMRHLKPSLRFNPTKYYISIVDKKNFAYIYVRKKKLVVVIMLPETVLRNNLKNHRVGAYSEKVQKFYGGECAGINVEDTSNLDEVITVLKLAIGMESK